MESVSGGPRVSEIVAKAATICDPHGRDESVAAVAQRFEDDDRPATAVTDLMDVISASFSEEGPEVIGPPASMTAAAAAWLATNFEYREDRERVLRESARAAFDGNPPPEVVAWLKEQGIAV
jgi:hypothetical protein